MPNFYYIKENVLTPKTGTLDIGKARLDIELILEELSVEPLPIEMESYAKGWGAIREYNRNHRALKGALSGLGNSDVLFIQYPLIKTDARLGALLSSFRNRGGRVVLLIHDLDSARLSTTLNERSIRKAGLRLLESRAIQSSDVVVAHNPWMQEYLEKTYGYPRNQTVSLDLFDYLGSSIMHLLPRTNRSDGVAIAGNLSSSKAGYVYHLPIDCDFYLYGSNCAIDELATGDYMGSFTPDELPNRLKGSYGLIWDGPSTESCSGPYGQYLRINNPHKASLYISAGLPIVAWSESAIAKFIEKHQVGFSIDSLENLGETIARVSDTDYSTFVRNVSALSQKVRTGGFTASAISKALELLEE